ncbi:MAG: DUF3576 domain-containing protein [Rhodospirillales bacterium]|nr:MAG: DUF3576 domain-containing protein [Rhodospirillales bacterium]
MQWCTPRMVTVVVALFAGALLVGCSGANVQGEYPDRRRGDATPYGNQRESVFGPGGLSLGGGGSRTQEDAGGGGIGVNGFLWRASLDTVSFMPVTSADPFGGVIITDWYSPPEAPDERFKMNVYILGRALRADGVRVAVFRQVADARAGWRDAPLAGETGTEIENAILTKARQLRADVLSN